MRQRPSRRIKTKRRQNGFTIIELLIATTVFATVFLILTFGLIQVGRIYYKGVTATKTQEASRTVMDTISRAIQFNGGAVVPTPASVSPGVPFAFCIGNQRYSVQIDRQVSDAPGTFPSQAHHAIVVDDLPGCTNATPPQDINNPGSLTASSRELLSVNMRLAELSIRLINNTFRLYEITVTVVSGEDDILESDTSNANYHKQCGSFRAGTQFCAASALTTVVQKRIR